MQLGTLLSVVVGLITIVALAVLSVLFNANLDIYRTETAEQAVRVRSKALGAILARHLYEEWRQVERAAGGFHSIENQHTLQDRVDTMAVTSEELSWIGIASTDGTVLASTRGLLVGQNVAQSSWFQQGLAGPFVGDVHGDLLQARLMQPTSSEPLRFVDLSAPVLDQGGNTVGVLAAHVNWRWIRALVAEAAQLLELDVFVVNREGTIILATEVIDEAAFEMSSLKAARRGVSAAFSETWPDGTRYETFTVPNLTYGTLPPLGWSLVARLDPAVLAAPQQRFQLRLGLAAIMAWSLVIVAFAIVAGILIRPLRRITRALLAQVTNQPVTYIREHRRFREVFVLSEVLARLQSSGRRKG